MLVRRGLGASSHTVSPSRRARSWGTTRSTPSGTGAPVKMSIAPEAPRDAGSARSAGIACDPILGFLEARDDFHDRARAVTAIELRANQPVPAVAASTVGSGQCVDHGTAGNPRTGPGLHGGDPDRFV